MKKIGHDIARTNYEVDRTRRSVEHETPATQPALSRSGAPARAGAPLGM